MRYVHEGPSTRALVVRTFAKAVVRPTLALYPTKGPLRHGMDAIELLARVQRRSGKVDVEHVRSEHWNAELVTPRGIEPGAEAIVYFHGGAFLFCGTATHRHVVERLALTTGLPVLSVDYRQNLRGTVADAIEDGIAATDWMMERGFDPSRMVLVGDSAGGHVAFQVAIAARDAGVPLAGVVGLSPWLDFDNSERSQSANARRDHYIPSARLDAIARLVTGRPILEPQLSPVNRDLHGLPSSLLVCAADEVLRHDAELMAQRLHAAGVQVELHVWQGQVHAFPVFGDLLPESSAALDMVADFVVARAGVGRLRLVDDVAV